MKKYFYLAAIFMFGVLAFSGKASAAEYSVSVDNNTGIFSGYAWSSNIGWIRFSGSGYGVTKDGAGLLSGYAWSSNVGWLSFNNFDVAGTCAPGASAQIDGSGNLTGWARFIGVTEASGNLGGCVHLSNLPTYGVTLGKNNTYAWSNDFGWISFYNKSATASLTVIPNQLCSVPDSATLNWTSSEASCVGANFSTGNAGDGSVGVTVDSLPKAYSITCGTAPNTATSSAVVQDGNSTIISSTKLQCLSNVCTSVSYSRSLCSSPQSNDADCAGKNAGDPCGPSANWKEVAP